MSNFFEGQKAETVKNYKKTVYILSTGKSIVKKRGDLPPNSN